VVLGWLWPFGIGPLPHDWFWKSPFSLRDGPLALLVLSVYFVGSFVPFLSLVRPVGTNDLVSLTSHPTMLRLLWIHSRKGSCWIIFGPVRMVEWHDPLGSIIRWCDSSPAAPTTDGRRCWYRPLGSGCWLGLSCLDSLGTLVGGCPHSWIKPQTCGTAETSLEKAPW